MASNATTKATTLPMIKADILFINTSVPPSKKSFSTLYPVAANIVGTAKKKENSAIASLDPKKASPEQLREYLAEVLPNFDRDRVHVGDIKKLISWYNTLISNGLTEFKPEAEVGEEETVAE